MAEETILAYLEKKEEIDDSGKFADEFGLEHDDVVNVTKSLHGYGLVIAQDIKREKWVLTDEGKRYAVDGSPEMQFFLAIPADGIPPDELQKKLDPSVYKIGSSQAMKNKWVERGKLLVSRKVQLVDDKVKQLLVKIEAGEVIDGEIDSLKNRKLITSQTWKGYSLKKGPNYAPKRLKAATDLTRENLQRGDVKDLVLKEYNFNAKGPVAECGHLHPLLKMSEMRTYPSIRGGTTHFDFANGTCF